ncbi:MAG: formylmethanofuran dehydrogenase subunit [Methanolobus sp.]|jgi:formylmethanofuran dehydrogenase subunit E|nr:formylmethanofuran dehydrogenase subunit [Methanolobus sp.]MDK2912946.1 formylmethanofuran dehydrogenase subunit [Methanolobus sp.]MDN5310995.1 formylmethanofuran dehydrogenase subunit [Methanolobus sp.]
MCQKCSNENANALHIPSFEEAAKFHGHVCPGLTIGYIAAKAALEKLHTERDVDEELVTIVENDACGVDAVQVLTGCTIGKGNLIYRDHAKQVFTFICRDSGKAVRAALRASFNIDAIDPEVNKLRPKVMSGKATGEETEEFRKRMDCISHTMRHTPVEEMFDIRFVDVEIPQKARIFNSLKCTKCGEMMAESRARVQNGEFVCIPCFEGYTRGW